MLVVGLFGFGSSCRSPQERTRVEVKPRVLIYFEGDKTLEFQIDRFPTGGVVYVPGPVRWHRELPAWAKDRRKEILSEMKRLAAKYNLEWEEYE